MATITINGNSFDPLAEQAEVNFLGPDGVDVTGSNYILLQTREPPTKEQKKQLRQLDVEILEYVSNDSYIAYYPPTDLSPLRDMPFIRWAGVYPHKVKVEPALRPQPHGAPPPASDASDAPAPPPASYDPSARDRRTVEVVLHGNVRPEAVREKIALAAGLDADSVEAHGNKVRMTLSAEGLDRLAQVDEVRHIEEFSGYKLCNNVARGLIGVDKVQDGGGSAAFAGAGEVIAVCDTGLDSGDPDNIHPAFLGRVARLYPLARPTASDPDGHGTHVAGAALGDYELPDGTPIRGAAPQATLVLQSILDDNDDITPPANLNDLFAPPYNDDGTRVHSNSWLDKQFMNRGRYTQQSREVDTFIWEHRDLVVCFGVGNEGVDESQTGSITFGSVMPPSTAKNCIAVGASESRRPALQLTYSAFKPERFPAEPIASDRLSNNPEGIAAFSGRGPTRDCRFKPDIVAPGSVILSTRSRIAAPETLFGTSPDPDLYMFDAGTSVATPLVAGCAAVVRESFRVRREINPSAALVRAMLINGATKLRGQYNPPELGPIPNESEGFGRVNLAASLAPEVGDELLVFRDEANALDVGDEESLTFTVADGAAGLKVTLVWTDPPGEVLQNDLDLIVRDASGAERHGNRPPNSAAFDRDNNVEQVIWTNVAPGDAQIIVRAFRIPVHEQSYALTARAF